MRLPDRASVTRFTRWLSVATALALAAACGVVLFCFGAARYSWNRWFWIKITLLAVIAVSYLIFRRGVYNNAAELDRAMKIAAREPAPSR